MQFDHLKVFRAVVENKSMNKAASVLYCTQPTVSATIKSMEQELGYPIIKRTAQGITPTSLGMHILNDVPVILGAYDRWKSFAVERSTTQPIEIVMTGTTPTHNIVNAISKTQATNPDLKIRINFQIEPGAATSHVNGRIGIQYKVPEHVTDALSYAHSIGLSMALIQQDHFVILASAMNPIADKESISLKELAGQQVLLYQNPERFPYIDRLRKEEFNFSSQMFHENNLMVAVSVMKDAVAIRPSKTVLDNPFVKDGSVRIIEIKNEIMPVDLYVTYPNKQRIFDSETLFLQSISESFPLFKELPD